MNLGAIDAQYAELESSLTDYLGDGGRLAVVKAPPGSGKTHTLIKVLATMADKGMRSAVAAQTNSQADDICRRFARELPGVSVARFASSGTSQHADFPASVPWITDKAALPAEPGVTVATSAKWALTDLPGHAGGYDLFAIDEAWQMAWADLMQCATISERFLMIGDPGQIPPIVTVDVRRWETSPRAPHKPAPEVILAEEGFASMWFLGSLPACRRLPMESVDFIRPFYDFTFAAYAEEGARGIDLPEAHGHLDGLRSGQPQLLTVPTPPHGPPIEVDREIAAAAAAVIEKLLKFGAVLRLPDEARPLSPGDIGMTSTHRVMNSALGEALGARANEIRVDTPERWQGLERPLIIAVHPLSGVTDPSGFDLETGRLCVMASRHQAGLIMLARDHVGETLRNYVPSAAQAPGRPDVVGRGHDAHVTFWEQLEAAGAIAAA